MSPIKMAFINPVTFSIGLLSVLAISVAVIKPPEPIQTALSYSQPYIPVTVSPTPTPPPYPIPVLRSNVGLPWLEARAVEVVDLTSNTPILEKNVTAQLYPASTTKMMTALVALEHYLPSDLVTVTNANESIGSKAQLMPKEIYTVEDLLYALLLDSGNDAAVTLAQHYPTGYTDFIAAMNQKASILSLKNTHFTNASGIESPYHFSSAQDLAIIAQELLRHDLLRTIVGTRTKTVIDHHFGHRLYLVSTNQLLGVIPGVEGIKTGSTELAGECLVTLVNQQQHPLLIVVLGSPDRFGETKSIIEWVYQNHDWR
jgi:D-alanyl-D-alanine carboxypeptidase (penicillin-binding protein 5/6)